MRRVICALVLWAVVCLIIRSPAFAESSSLLGTFSVGVGVNQGTDNEADETFCLSFKERLPKWEYGLDICMAEDRGGVGDNNFAFVWVSWIDDFQRPEWQDYGFYGGGGAGALLLSDELVEWSAGPFVLMGWDLSPQAGLEGKVGYFGDSFWGTANLYWYFR